MLELPPSTGRILFHFPQSVNSTKNNFCRQKRSATDDRLGELKCFPIMPLKRSRHFMSKNVLGPGYQYLRPDITFIRAFLNSLVRIVLQIAQFIVEYALLKLKKLAINSRVI